MKRLVSFFTLFTSLSTLLCCAIPALLVALGMGAALAGFLSRYPQLIWISENKLAIFVTGAILLLLGGLLQWKQKNEPCPIGPKAQDCAQTRKLSIKIYYFSLVVYFVGVLFAYILPAILG